MKVALLAFSLSAAGVAAPAPSPSPSPSATIVPSTEEKDFPSDIPRYHPARNELFRMSDSGAMAYLRTSDRPEAVARFYDAFARRERWAPDPDLVAERKNGRILIYRKGDRILRVNAFVNPLVGVTEVSLLVAHQLESPGPTPASSPAPGGKR